AHHNLLRGNRDRKHLRSRRTGRTWNAVVPWKTTLTEFDGRMARLSSDPSPRPRLTPAVGRKKGTPDMSAINLSQFLANKITNAGNALREAVAKMPDDRIGWHPETEGNQGRDALDQALECAYLNEWVAQGYRTQEMPGIDWNDYKAQTDARRNKADCLAWLASSTEALASAIADFPAD